MSTIGGLTGSTTSNIRGYGGLASGMDRDSLIEGMTYGTTSKITKKKQKKQPAYQNIYKPLLADIPQAYIADQKTIADSLRSSEKVEPLSDNQKIEKKLDSEDEKDGTDH